MQHPPIPIRWPLWTLGCSCAGEPPTSPPSAAPPTAPPASATVTELASPAQRVHATPMSSVEAAQFSTWLREARRASHARDCETALDRFDRMVAQSPNAPHTLCEAGYVAHLAGRDADAARRARLDPNRAYGRDRNDAEGPEDTERTSEVRSGDVVSAIHLLRGVPVRVVTASGPRGLGDGGG